MSAILIRKPVSLGLRGPFKKIDRANKFNGSIEPVCGTTSLMSTYNQRENIVVVFLKILHSKIQKDGVLHFPENDLVRLQPFKFFSIFYIFLCYM